MCSWNRMLSFVQWPGRAVRRHFSCTGFTDRLEVDWCVRGNSGSSLQKLWSLTLVTTSTFPTTTSLRWVNKYTVLHIPNDLVLMGNFSLHVHSLSSDARQLTGILKSFDLQQYVEFPPHIYGHSHDLTICSAGCNVLSVSTSDLISDHFSVIADLRIPSNHSRTVPQTINYRTLQAISIEAFKDDSKNSEMIRHAELKQLDLAQQESSSLWSIFMPHRLPKISSSGLLTHEWLLPSWLLNDIVNIWRASDIEIRPH